MATHFTASNLLMTQSSKVGATMDRAITITTDKSKIERYGWDFPIEELEYLVEEHDGETFVLMNGRLYEAKDI